MPAQPAISMAPDLPHLALFFGVGITLLLLRSLRWLYVLVVLPGTILHELTHLIMGYFLGARPAKFGRGRDGSYLTHVLGRIAEHPINRIEELLPWNVAVQLKPSLQKAA